MRFDYLHQSVPDSLDRIRSVRVQKEFQAPFGAILTALLVVIAAWGIEGYRLAEARAALASAKVLAEQSRQQLAKTKLVRIQVDRMLALDRRLREIHLSGTTLSERLADIANHVPHEAWLTSISREQGQIDINGRAEGFRALSDTIAGLMSSKAVRTPTLVRAGRDDGIRGSVLSFEMRVQDQSR